MPRCIIHGVIRRSSALVAANRRDRNPTAKASMKDTHCLAQQLGTRHPGDCQDGGPRCFDHIENLRAHGLMPHLRKQSKLFGAPPSPKGCST